MLIASPDKKKLSRLLIYRKKQNINQIFFILSFSIGENVSFNFDDTIREFLRITIFWQLEDLKYDSLTYKNHCLNQRVINLYGLGNHYCMQEFCNSTSLEKVWSLWG